MIKKSIKFISGSPEITQKIAKEVASFINKDKLFTKATVIGLEGELGGGKTTFLQGFIPFFGVGEKILSPTFVIMKKFDVKEGRFKRIYHFDVYRITEEKEMKALNFKEIINDPNNLVLIEWSNLIKKVLPKEFIRISFKSEDENTRGINLEFPNSIIFNKFKMLNLTAYGRK